MHHFPDQAQIESSLFPLWISSRVYDATVNCFVLCFHCINVHDSKSRFSVLKGSLSRSKKENKLYKDLYCTLEREVLIRFIQRNQGHEDSIMHEFSSSVNKVNKAVAKVRTIGDRLPLRKG